MKKNDFEPYLQGYWLRKLFMRMKIAALLIVLFTSVSFAKTLAQETVSINVNNASIIDILDNVEKQTNIGFVFKVSELDLKRRYDINESNISVDELLSVLFDTENVEYKKVGKNVVLKGKIIYSTNTQQKTITITGIVTDSEGEAIPGVNVFQTDNVQNGTITDIEGKYTVAVDSESVELTYSFIGFVKQILTIGNRREINVALQSSFVGLDEIVAVGYGTAKKSDLTGSIGTVKGLAISKRQTTQVADALQGQMAGVMVTRSNGTPGAAASIRIRGITSITKDGKNEGKSAPLIIIDGIPGSLTDVNANDIESLVVLKDAASASIYGSRAAAGVILITTKRAKTGQVSVDYNYSYGIDKPTQFPNFVPAKRQIELMNE